MTAAEIVELVATALADDPRTIDVHGPAPDVVEVRTDRGTFRVQVSEIR